MKFITSTSFLAAAVLLSACGGSSSGGSAFTETGPITVANLNDAGEEIFEFIVASENDEVDPLGFSQLQAIGSAEYNGFMIAEPEASNEALVGRTQISADFSGDGSLTGSVTNLAFFSEGDAEDVFLEDDEDLTFEPIPADTAVTQLDGELSLSNGRVRSVNGFGVFAIDVDGDVTVPGSLIEGATSDDIAFEVTGELDGAVAETGYLIAEGTLNGSSDDFEFDLDTVIFAE